MKIKPGQRYRYVGAGDTRGLLHTVVGVSADEVVTWSDPVSRASLGGMSWLGPVNDFMQQFQAAN